MTHRERQSAVLTLVAPLIGIDDRHPCNLCKALEDYAVDMIAQAVSRVDSTRLWEVFAVGPHAAKDLRP